MPKSALIVVDVQRDFCEGGALAAVDTLSLLEPLRKTVEAARRAGAVIVFTQDWHPANHSSFQANGGPWPVHCVANTPGARLMEPMCALPEDVVIHKGVSVDGPGYSGFEATGLAEKLKGLGVAQIAVSGIATEYCVKATALDAAKAQFDTVVLTDLLRAVQPGEAADVLAGLSEAGVKAETAKEWLGTL